MRRIAQFISYAATGCLALATAVGCDSNKRPPSESTSMNHQSESTAHAASLKRSTSASGPAAQPGTDVTNLVVDGDYYIAGTPSLEGIRELKARGVRTVIDVRLTEQVPAGYREQVLAEGLQYVHIPMRPDALTGDQADAFRAAMRASNNEPVLIHCQSGNRAAGMYGVHLGCDLGLTISDALERARRAGLKHPDLIEDLRRYLESHGAK